MSAPFQDKNAYVSGAASGIGLALARHLLSVGANVALCDIREQDLEKIWASVSGLPGRAILFPVDVSDRSALERAAAEIERILGPIHLVFNNAGIAMHGVRLNRLVRPTGTSSFKSTSTASSMAYRHSCPACAVTGAAVTS
jgi:NAD(P)-dependent dehydrogenase (short-subunit alcohol dehydrogenase family)